MTIDDLAPITDRVLGCKPITERVCASDGMAIEVV